MRDRIRKWEREVKEYEEISVDVVQESIRMGVLQDVLVDPELRRHLIINATRMNSYAEMKNEVEAALDASDDMDAMAVSAIDYGKGWKSWCDADPMHVSGLDFGKGWKSWNGTGRGN